MKLNISTSTVEAGGTGTPASSEGPTFTLDELLSVFDAKLFCTSPRRAAAAASGAFGSLHSNGGSSGGASLFSTPEPLRIPPSAFEGEQRACGAAFAAVAQVLSPNSRSGKGWFATGQSPLLPGSHSPLAEAWGSGGFGGESDGTDSPLAPRGLFSSGLAWSSSERSAFSGSCNSCGGGESATGAGSSNSAAGGAGPSRLQPVLGADDCDDAVCVVEVAMAAAVEATTRPPRGGRGGKHRQKAKLNASLQQLAGHPDSEGAHAYVESALSTYRRNHPGDAAALELLTRHLAYLIGGVARYRLAGSIPWTQLPVPEPHELADKSRTPTYKTWLTRLGVVGAEAFEEGSLMMKAALEEGSGGGSSNSAAAAASPRAAA